MRSRGRGSALDEPSPAAALALAVLLAGCLSSLQGAAPASAEVVILSVSDWHGQLDPLRGLGGAAVLSAYFAEERRAHARTLTVTAGDSFGATPPLAGFFADEPAALAMNLMGFDANTLGNHDFDAGVARTRRITELAEFPFLAANLAGAEVELPRVEPWRLFEVGGVKVGLVGLVNEDASTLTKPGSLGNVSVTDAAAAAMRAQREMRAAGAEALVILTHKGVNAQGKGALADLARNVTGFDLIVGDHTNARFEARVNGALVIENPSKGVEYARTTLLVDRAAQRVTSARVEFVEPRADAIEPDARVEEMLVPYRARLAPEMDVRVAVATEEIGLGNDDGMARDAPIGNLAADALREAARVQVAFRNSGGIRSALPSSYVPADASLRRVEAPFDVVRGDIFTALPFANAIVAGETSGASIWAAVEHGLTLEGRPPDVSGIRVLYDSARPAGSRVVSITLDGSAPPCPASELPCDSIPRGAPVLPDESRYSIATLDFVALGGNGYTMFRDLGASGALETDALIAHLARLGEVSPNADGRMLDLASTSKAQ